MNLKNFFSKQKIKKCVGGILVVIGFIGLVTPFTPWGFIFFVGLEIMGVHFLWLERIKKRLAFLNIFTKRAPPGRKN